MALEQKVPSTHATDIEHAPMVAGVALFSKDAKSLASFYNKVARIVFKHRVHDDGREHHIADLGDVKLEIKALNTTSGERTSDAGSTDAIGVSRSEVSIRVPDVAGAVARAIVNGGKVLQKAQSYSWGIFAVVLDPDANRLGLWSPPINDETSPTEETA